MVSMDVYGIVWLSVDVHECMDVYGCLWMFMVACTTVCVMDVYMYIYIYIYRDVYMCALGVWRPGPERGDGRYVFLCMDV